MKTIYALHCDECGRYSDIRDRDKPCPKEKNEELWSSGVGFNDDYGRRRFPFFDDTLDCWVESRGHRNKILKENGLVSHSGFYRGSGRGVGKKGVKYFIPKDMVITKG